MLCAREGAGPCAAVLCCALLLPLAGPCFVQGRVQVLLQLSGTVPLAYALCTDNKCTDNIGGKQTPK